MTNKDLNKQAQEILEIAEKHGVEQNFFFLTTFKRYQVQIGILNDLEKTIKEEANEAIEKFAKEHGLMGLPNKGTVVHEAEKMVWRGLLLPS